MTTDIQTQWSDVFGDILDDAAACPDVDLPNLPEYRWAFRAQQHDTESTIHCLGLGETCLDFDTVHIGSSTIIGAIPYVPSCFVQPPPQPTAVPETSASAIASRADKIRRYRRKRKQRIHFRRVLYTCRREYAMQRKRDMNGRFIKRQQVYRNNGKRWERLSPPD